MPAPPERRGGVVVVGSLHHDIMVDAPSRPRPGETVVGARWRPKFGGKGGNQAVAAAGAGAKAKLAGAVGDDAFGAYLLTGLDAAGVDRRHVRVVSGAASGMSVAITDADGEYGAVIVSGANLLIEEAALDPGDLWTDARVLLLQNEVREAVNLAAARRARRAGLLVWLNAAPARTVAPDLARLVDVLIVNALEAEMLAGITVATLDDALRAALELGRGRRGAVVTAGAAGVAAAIGGRAFAVPAVKVGVVSTHGAGDVFVGVMAAEVAAGRSWEAAVARANRAAAAHVSLPPQASAAAPGTRSD